MGLPTWLRRRPRVRAPSSLRLLPSTEAIARYQREGGDQAAALRGARDQLIGLRCEIADDERWARLVRLARQAGDPWNADDWPLGFDALVCAIPVCTHMSFECARCPVGRRQDGRSCAHPTTAFGRIGDLVRRGDRGALRRHLDAVEALLREARSELP